MARRGGFAGGMPGNMNNLMKQAQRMQRQMEENKKALEEKEFKATAGGGAVEVVMTGAHEMKAITWLSMMFSDRSPRRAANSWAAWVWASEA